jgi:hypothetical protein
MRNEELGSISRKVVTTYLMYYLSIFSAKKRQEIYVMSTGIQAEMQNGYLQNTNYYVIVNSNISVVTCETCLLLITQTV